MTKDEALKMAIKTLRRAYVDCKGVNDPNYCSINIDFKMADKTIRACREALELSSVAELNDEYLRDTHVEGLQPTQEPVGYTEPADLESVPIGDTGLWFAKKDERYSVALYTHPAPICKCEECGMRYCECGEQ